MNESTQSPGSSKRAPHNAARRFKSLSRSAAYRGKQRTSSIASRNKKLASAFYGLADNAFKREHFAVIAGRRRYQELERGGQQRFLLRRNTHMLEKGLVMRPRRSVFATDYIEATVDTFKSLCAQTGSDMLDTELQWANDVLAAYFEIAGEHPAIDSARAKFQAQPLGSDLRSTTPGLSPYARDLSKPPALEYEALLELAMHRRSVRWFADKQVPRELIDKAFVVAGLSPSACNRQPFEFRVFDDPEHVKKIANIPMGTRGYADNIPVFAVIIGDLSAFFSERDRHLIYTDGCLAAMSFLLALESLGLSSCCVNWPDIDEREAAMANALNLRPDQRPVMCIALGYPDEEGMVPYSQKKPLEQLRRYNFE